MIEFNNKNTNKMKNGAYSDRGYMFFQLNNFRKEKYIYLCCVFTTGICERLTIEDASMDLQLLLFGRNQLSNIMTCP